MLFGVGLVFCLELFSSSSGGALYVRFSLTDSLTHSLGQIFALALSFSLSLTLVPLGYSGISVGSLGDTLGILWDNFLHTGLLGAFGQKSTYMDGFDMNIVNISRKSHI